MATMITCPHCNKVDKVKATYTCHSAICGTRVWNDGPKPQGVPHSQPCPGPGCGQSTPYSSFICQRCID